MAVSGGVDSISLLHILASMDEYELVVAHFNHGIRSDSDLDMQLVHDLSAEYGLEFVCESADLGEYASEATARTLRYEFLLGLKDEYGARAILTAHHLDDRIETMELNRQRGSGWRGLAPLKETDDIKRPLLNIWKSQLIEYARENNLNWREDSTNKVLDTPRNHLRDKLAGSPKLKEELHQQLISNDKVRDDKEKELGKLAKEIISTSEGTITIDRSKLLSLDKDIARDLLFYVLTNIKNLDISNQLVIRLEHFIKTAKTSKQTPISKDILAIAEAEAVVINTNTGVNQ